MKATLVKRVAQLEQALAAVKADDLVEVPAQPELAEALIVLCRWDEQSREAREARATYSKPRLARLVPAHLIDPLRERAKRVPDADLTLKPAPASGDQRPLGPPKGSKMRVS